MYKFYIAETKKLNSEKGVTKNEKKYIKISMTPPMDPINYMMLKTCLLKFPCSVDICKEN
jgi:hypothetical protein